MVRALQLQGSARHAQPSIRAVHRLASLLACWPAVCWPPACAYDRRAVCASGAGRIANRRRAGSRVSFRWLPLRPRHLVELVPEPAQRDLLQQAVEVSDSAHARCQRGRMPCATCSCVWLPSLAMRPRPPPLYALLLPAAHLRLAPLMLRRCLADPLPAPCLGAVGR